MNNTCDQIKIAHCTRKIRDVATKTSKLEQTNESPTIQFLPETNFIHNEKKTRSGKDSKRKPSGAKATTLPLGQSGTNLAVCSGSIKKASKKIE